MSGQPPGYLDLPRRTLAEAAGVKRGTPVEHDELGRGTVRGVTQDGRYAVVDFAGGQRFTVHIADLRRPPLPGGAP